MATPACFLIARRLWRIALVLAVLACPGPPTHAQRATSKNDTLPKAPPQPMAASVRVKRGEPVEIPLRIYGTRSQTLEFLLRALPQSGRLSEIRSLGQESAAVTYWPARESGPGRDKFSYAVRSREGVSASVEVLIEIIDVPPQFNAPATLAFPKTIAGEKSEQFLEIGNRGGGTLQGEIELEGPWQIDGPRKFQLGPNEARRLKILFVPKTAGSFSGRVRFGAQFERGTELLGESVSTVTFPLLPAPLVLAQGDPQSSRRSASLEVLNQSGRPQTVAFRADARLVFERTLTLAPHQSASLLVQTQPGDLAPLEAAIQMNAPGGDSTVTVQAGNSRQTLRADRQSVHFEALAPHTTARQDLDIENTGPKALPATLEISGDGFFLEQTALDLAPGRKKTVSLRFEAGEPGVFRGLLSVRGDSVQLKVPLEAQVLAALPIKAAAVPAIPAIPAIPAPSARPASEPRPEPGGGRFEKIKVEEITATTARLEWPQKKPGVTRFKVLWRAPAIQNGELIIRWIESEAFSPKSREGRWTETLTDLQPGTAYFVRIVGVTGPEDGAPPQFAAEFITKPLAPRRYGPWVMGFGVLALAAGWFWRKMRRVRLESASGR